MKVLVVGCGYVGMATGGELARQGHEVFGMRRSSDAEAEMRALGLKPLLADITVRESLGVTTPDFDWVINCASASGGGAQEYRRVYVEGNRNLVGWLAGSPVRRFVYTSSTGVYGQDDGSRVEESSATTPASDTGKLLVAAEQTLLEAARQGFPAVILRLAGIYGPGRGYWLKQFLAGEARLEGTGSRILNMIHRHDVTGAIVAALQRGQAGEIYNVVDDQPVSQLELFQWLATKLGRSMPGTGPGQAQAFRRRATSKVVSNRRLRQELGYQLRYPSFREGFSAELAASS